MTLPGVWAPVADLLTGFYLVVVAVKDQQFRSQYHEHAYYWMTSWQCTLTGILAMTSAEVSSPKGTDLVNKYCTSATYQLY